MQTKTSAKHLRTGTRGEALAARYLEKQGLILLARNWRCRDGELDIVATDGSILIVCEVKTRTGTDFGTPAEAVDDDKANRIRRLFRRFRAEHNLPCDARFDIVAVVWPRNKTPSINHLKGVF